MGTENEETLEDEHEDDEGEEEAPKSKKEVVMSQRRFSAVMTREKDEGRRAAKRDLLGELGVEDVDELKDIVKAAQDAADKDTNDTARLQREADQARRVAEAAKAEAKQARFEAKLDRRLMAADVPAKRVDKVRRLLDVEVGAEDDEVADAIEDLKEEFPDLFRVTAPDTSEDEEESNGSQRSGPTHSDPGRSPRKKQSPASVQDQAKSLLHERHPNLARQSQ